MSLRRPSEAAGRAVDIGAADEAEDGSWSGCGTRSGQTERTIRELEAEEVEERRRREVARRESSWKIQPKRAEKGHPLLHRGACSVYGEQLGFVNREEVELAFREFPDMQMCTVCNPWGSLGVPKPVPGRRMVVADPDGPA